MIQEKGTHTKPPKRLPRKCTCANVRAASRVITKLYDTIMEPSGLKVTQFSVLRNVEAAGPLSVTALARVMNLDRTTLVRNLKVLDAGNLVQRAAGKDSRERLIAITARGRDAIDGALPYWEEAQKKVEDHLGSEDLEKLVTLLMALESFPE